MKKPFLILLLIFCVFFRSGAQQDGKAILTFDRIKIDMGKISSKEKHLLRFPGLILTQQSTTTNPEL